MYGRLDQFETAASYCYLKGAAEREAGNLEGASSSLKSSGLYFFRASNNTKAAEAYFQAGQFYQQLGDLDAAAAVLEESLSADTTGPQAEQAHQLLANVYDSMGRFDLAELHR